MIPRHRLLQAPHMSVLLDHPALDAMADGEIRALEAFMGFCAEHHVDNPGRADILAFTRLRDQTPGALQDLRRALRRLGLGEDLLVDIEAIHATLTHKATFGGITKGSSRAYKRHVSLSVEDLPTPWQTTLRRLDLQDKYAPSIMKRMKGRLGMFAWSAQQAGRPVDLADTDALRALYADMKSRSIERQRKRAKKQGLCDDIAEPRWAYLRSAWEEMRRFAQHHDLPDEVRDKLNVTYSHLVEKEERQTAEKVRKATTAGTREYLLKKAEAMLAEAETLKQPQMRHAMRNRAAATAMGCAVPARPEDVKAHHAFGAGVIFEPARGGYRFRYKASKTAGTTGADIDIPLRPWWNRFLDAIILQDHDPRYLGPLRAKAMSEQRPLYVHYDGTPATYPWYSRMWVIVAGTGGQIARALAYDDPGAAGILYGSAVNGHRPGSSVVRKYETDALGQARILKSQEIMAALFDDDDDEPGRPLA